MKQLPVAVRVSRWYSSRSDDGVELTVEDNTSGITFLTIKMTLEEYGNLISTTGQVRLEAELRGLENLGKNHEMQPRTAVVPKDVADAAYALTHSEQAPALRKWMEANLQEEGWHISTYLGSRDSIKWGGPIYGKPEGLAEKPTTVKYHVYRWV